MRPVTQHERDGTGGAPRPHPALCDPARLQALHESGLTAEADPVMDVFAERVRRWLGVPVALVSVVQPDRQVLPGLAGLPEPWATHRATPISHSFCQHVVTTARPLVVSDAREHPLVQDNLAVPDLKVVAYLGMPLTDADGHVLGSLCAIDSEPRSWTDDHVQLLRELAYACSTELRLRLARVDAARERRRRDELDVALHRSFERSQTLLAASQAFTDTRTVQDVRARIGELVDSELRPSYVGLVLRYGRRLRRLPDARMPPGAEDDDPWSDYGLDSPLLTATAVREQRLIHYSDRAAFDADHPPEVSNLLLRLGLHAVVAAPLPGTDGPLGAVVLGWDAPRPLESADLVTVTTIAGYAAQALGRARHLQERVSVAHRLQQAMLTTLPDLPDLPMAAGYRPADSREDVGGDWYDVSPMPDPARADDLVLSVSVGDVIGHTLQAATVMGQVRSMLRQAAWDHPGGPPSRILTAFEDADTGLGLGAAGTAVLAQLRRDRAGNWTLVWTNAGHPGPVLISPDGGTEVLAEHDALFGFRLVPTRTDHHRPLPPGTTLFLYTDGLVERRGSDIDAGTERLLGLLDGQHRRPVADLVEEVLSRLGADALDDVVALAVRVPGPD